MTCNQQVLFGDIVTDFVGGGTPNRGVPEFWGGDIPWATVKDMTSGELSKTQEFISADGVKNSATKIIPAGSLIIVTRMALGKCAINTVDVAINQDLKAILPSTHFDVVFLKYWYESKSSDIQALGSGSTVKGIRLESLRKLTINLPPIGKQREIAVTLSTWDRAIELHDKLIALKEKQKQGLMQVLLTGKKRLLDDNGVPFSGEWVEEPLGLVSKMSSGGTPKSSINEYYGNDIPWVSIADMTKQGRFITCTERGLSTLGLENSSAKIYPVNTVLYAMYASIGECSVAKIPLCSSQAILGIQPFEEVLDYNFLYFYLTSIKSSIQKQGQQGTQSNLNAGMVKSLKINLPPLFEQKKIANVLLASDSEISAIKRKRDILTKQKQGLMQKLLG